MDPVTIIATINAGTQLVTTLVPHLLELANAAKAGASADDAAAIDAATAKLTPLNDALHAQVQALG